MNLRQNELDSLNDQVQLAWEKEAIKKAEANRKMFWTVIGVVLVVVAVSIIVML
jgi:type IV secretory pathway component VirB8